MQIAVYLGLTIESEAVLQTAYMNVASRHKRDPGIRQGCHRAARFTEVRLNAARELSQKFGATSSHDPRLLPMPYSMACVPMHWASSGIFMTCRC